MLASLLVVHDRAGWRPANEGGPFPLSLWSHEMQIWLSRLYTYGEPDCGPPVPPSKEHWREEDHCLFAALTVLCMSWKSRTGPKGGDLHLAGFLQDLFAISWSWAYREQDPERLNTLWNQFRKHRTP